MRTVSLNLYSPFILIFVSIICLIVLEHLNAFTVRIRCAILKRPSPNAYFSTEWTQGREELWLPPAFSFTPGRSARLGQQADVSAAVSYKLAVQIISQQSVICCSLRLSINTGQINGA